MKIVPMNFSFVNETIMRSSLPEAKHFPFLESLGIRTCVLMCPDGISQTLSTWMAENRVLVVDALNNRGDSTRGGARSGGVDTIKVAAATAGGSGAGSPHSSPSGNNGAALVSSMAAANNFSAIQEDVVNEVLRILMQPQQFGTTLVVDPLGRHWTGAVVGCYRKVCRWNLSSILEEYRRFALQGKGRLEVEEFLETFDVESIISYKEQQHARAAAASAVVQ